MLKYKLNPRFKDTDALGHINNASFATWFEEGRLDIFKFFIPTLEPSKWNLIMARIEIDYRAQGHFEKECTIETYVKKIGNSSFTLFQQCYQKEVLLAEALSYLVHFDYEKQTSVAIPEVIKKRLQEHLIIE